MDKFVISNKQNITQNLDKNIRSEERRVGKEWVILCWATSRGGSKYFGAQGEN